MTALFHDEVLFLVYLFSRNNECILQNTKSPEGLEKTYIDFSNNTFPIDPGIINYVWGLIMYREFDLFINILNFNDYLEQ